MMLFNENFTSKILDSQEIVKPCVMDHHQLQSPFNFVDKVIYIGEWRNGFPHGLGTS